MTRQLPTTKPARKETVMRVGGRQRGTTNIPALEKIRLNRHRLEKILLDKALSGDVAAIQACIELLDRESAAENPSAGGSG